LSGGGPARRRRGHREDHPMSATLKAEKNAAEKTAPPHPLNALLGYDPKTNEVLVMLCWPSGRETTGVFRDEAQARRFLERNSIPLA
jgi:hypothetical protein